MQLGLDGKVVAITGGASGIGLACALRYLAEGCNVAICGRNEEKMDKVAAHCQALGYEPSRLLCVRTDVADPVQLEGFANATVEHFGSLNIWYNNAGFGIRKAMMDLSLEDWDCQMATNLRAVFLGCQLAAQRMHQGGVIVNASSWGARMPVVNNGVYAVSKWGVEGLTRIFAAELAPKNIRVFSYMPGMIETDLTSQRIAANPAAFTSSIALNRIGTPDDLAPILVMLTSELSAYFTGCGIEISGGKFCVQNPSAAW